MGSLPPVAILAGGLGTRLGAAAGQLPKAMVPVAGRPFIEHVLDLLESGGADRVVICRGNRGEAIEQALGDGRRFGLRISYSDEGPEPIGTAQALRGALPLLGDAFLVLYGDTYLRLDYGAAAAAHRRSGLPAMMTVLRNDGRWGESNATFANGRVTYDKRHPPAGAAWIDYGLLAFRASALEDAPERDLADVLARLGADGRLAGLEVRRRFYEIGTPEALAETDRFLRRTTLSRAGSQPPGAPTMRRP